MIFKNAVTAHLTRISNRELLFFDTIWVVDLDKRLDELSETLPESAANYRYLADQGVLKSIPLFDPSDEHIVLRMLMASASDSARRRFAETDLEKYPGLREMVEDFGVLFRSHQAEVGAFMLAERTRLAALDMADRHGRVVPLIPEGFGSKIQLYDAGRELDQIRIVFQSSLIPRRLGNMAQVPPPWAADEKEHRGIEIGISRLRVPASGIPLEALLEFREGVADGSRAAYHALISELVRGGSSPRDLRDRLLELEARFSAAMAAHRLEAQASGIRLLLKVPLGTVEDLVKLRFNSAFDRLLTLGDDRVALKKAEIGAEGHEVAFLAEVNRDLANPWAGGGRDT